MKNIILLCLIIGIVVLCTSCTQTNEQREPGTDTVVISGMKFNPETITVHKNDTIIWINEDLVAHNVAAFPDMGWKSDTIAVGESWKRVADENLNYFCSIHPTMKGKIVIR